MSRTICQKAKNLVSVISSHSGSEEKRLADQINLYSQVLESQYKQIGSAKDSEVGSYKSNLSAYTAYID